MLKKTGTPTVVEVAKKPRRKNPPRTAFKKGENNGHQWQPGQSGNPTGKHRASDNRMSKKLLIDLGSRAPDEICHRLSMPTRSSWGQCLSRRLLLLAMAGDLMAFRELREWTEGSRVDLHGFGTFDHDAPDVPPLLEIVFVDGFDGRPKEPVTIEATPELPETVD